MLKLILNVACLLFLSILTAAEFCNLGHLQGNNIISFQLRHPYKNDSYLKLKTNIQNSTLNFVILRPVEMT